MRKKRGFTLIEMIVSIAILGLILAVVIPNLRAGQRSGRLEAILRQTVSATDAVRVWALTGKITDGIYPVGGYAIGFIPRLNLYLQEGIDANGGGSNATLTYLPSDIKLTIVCHNDDTQITNNLPCAGTNWVMDCDVNSLPICGVFAKYKPSGSVSLIPDFRYIGGVLEQTSTGKKAYFYISRDSGAISYGLQ